MVSYRLYHLDRATGRIRDAEDLEADDDIVARALAAERATGDPMELWRRSTKIQDFDAGLSREFAQRRTPE